MASARDDSYMEATVRITPPAAISATAISTLMLVQVWGDWHSVAVVGAVQTGLMSFNLWTNLAWIRRSVRTAEATRTVVNAVGVITMALAGGFPIAIWLWLPFIALTFDHVNPRAGLVILVAMAAALDGMALAAGQSGMVPLMFNVAAAVCVAISRAHSANLRDILARSDQQRDELAAANARLIEEVRAREQVELELRQAQKLEAIGRLASGIAHEINTPVQFVSDSVHFIDDAARDLLTLSHRARANVERLVAGAPVPEVVATFAQLEVDADLPYLIEHLPVAINRSLDGLQRISTIVRSMKEFAHPDLRHAVAADLNRALLATITIAAHEYRMVADVDFQPGELPQVTCRAGEINQVFLNLLVNASHAIADVVAGTSRKGRITVTTALDGADAVVTVADTGAGIPPEIRDRIFEPFFTTKGVGRGTGQGLAIARNVIRHHGGSLSFESVVGRGTTFTIRLPVVAADPAALAQDRISTQATAPRAAS